LFDQMVFIKNNLCSPSLHFALAETVSHEEESCCSESQDSPHSVQSNPSLHALHNAFRLLFLHLLPVLALLQLSVELLVGGHEGEEGVGDDGEEGSRSVQPILLLSLEEGCNRSEGAEESGDGHEPQAETVHLGPVLQLQFLGGQLLPDDGVELGQVEGWSCEEEGEGAWSGKEQISSYIFYFWH
jgi:hypothetical protein